MLKKDLFMDKVVNINNEDTLASLNFDFQEKIKTAIKSKAPGFEDITINNLRKMIDKSNLTVNEKIVMFSDALIGQSKDNDDVLAERLNLKQENIKCIRCRAKKKIDKDFLMLMQVLDEAFLIDETY